MSWKWSYISGGVLNVCHLGSVYDNHQMAAGHGGNVYQHFLLWCKPLHVFGYVMICNKHTVLRQ